MFKQKLPVQGAALRCLMSDVCKGIVIYRLNQATPRVIFCAKVCDLRDLKLSPQDSTKNAKLHIKLLHRGRLINSAAPEPELPIHRT